MSKKLVRFLVVPLMSLMLVLAPVTPARAWGNAQFVATSAGAAIGASGTVLVHQALAVGAGASARAHIHLNMNAFAQAGTAFTVIGATQAGFFTSAQTVVLGTVVLNEFGEGSLFLASDMFAGVGASANLSIVTSAFGCPALIPAPIIAYANLSTITVVDASGQAILIGSL
jgi:hypothetical protein